MFISHLIKGKKSSWCCIQYEVDKSGNKSSVRQTNGNMFFLIQTQVFRKVDKINMDCRLVPIKVKQCIRGSQYLFDIYIYAHYNMYRLDSGHRDKI